MNAQHTADIITSSWALAAEPSARLPSGQDVLDRALQIAIEQGHFPEYFRAFRFVATPTGIRCPELRAALRWAQASDQTEDPNPTYDATGVKSSAFVAKVLLRGLSISPEDARRWGDALLAAVREQQSNRDSFRLPQSVE